LREDVICRDIIRLPVEMDEEKAGLESGGNAGSQGSDVRQIPEQGKVTPLGVRVDVESDLALSIP
jgi:hypothetical protein